MKKSVISSFKFEGYSIIRSLFEMTNSDVQTSLSIGFAPSGKINTDKSRFELELGVLIVDEYKLFKVEIQALGIFTFDSNVNEDTLNNLFYVNAPAILFPYIRAYITTLTTLSGLQPIILPTLNLSNLGSDLKKNTVTI